MEGGSAPVHVRSCERLHTATAASPAPTNPSVTAITYQVHHSPWWSSSRAVIAATARSNASACTAVVPMGAAHHTQPVAVECLSCVYRRTVTG